MPGRRFSQAVSGYRYGFNGKENDKDAGEGIQDYGMRIYDVRLGKFLSVDPLTKDYPWYTPYQFAGNKPIWAVDLDGAEEKPYYHAGSLKPAPGTPRSSYKTNVGNDAEQYSTRDFGTFKMFRITKITTNETVKDVFGMIHEMTYYFVYDKTLVNENNVESKDGKTVFNTKGTNWHFWMTNNNLSINAKQINGVANGLGIGAFSLAVAGSAAFAAPTVFTSAQPYISQFGRWGLNNLMKDASIKATAWQRFGSVSSDVLSQYLNNVAAGKGWGWNNVGNMNMTNTFFAGLMPGSNYVSGFGGSLFEINFNQGYVGVGSENSSTSALFIKGATNTGGNIIGNKLSDATGNFLKWNTFQSESFGNLIGNSIGNTFQLAIDNFNASKNEKNTTGN